MIFLAGTGGFLAFWTLVGLVNGQAGSKQVLSELMAVSTTIFTAWLGFFALRRGIVRAVDEIKAIILAISAMETMKLLLVVASLVYGLKAAQLMEAVFGQATVVSGPIGFGLVRMQFPQDILAPFALFALLTPEVSGVRFGRALTMLISAVLLVSGFITFSRFIWAAFVVAGLVAIILQRNWKALTFVAVAAAIAIVATGPFYKAVLYQRFQSHGVEVSDAIRVQQSRALSNDFERSPFLGRGLGGHDSTVIRSTVAPFSYEVEWLAILMQFGMIGFAGILLLVGTAWRDLLKSKHPARFWVAVIFLMWLAASFTNPYILTSFAGVTFAMFIAIFHSMRYNLKPKSC